MIFFMVFSPVHMYFITVCCFVQRKVSAPFSYLNAADSHRIRLFLCLRNRNTDSDGSAISNHTVDGKRTAAHTFQPFPYIPDSNMRGIVLINLLRIKATAVVLNHDVMVIVFLACNYSDNSFLADTHTTTNRIFHHWLKCERGQ